MKKVKFNIRETKNKNKIKNEVHSVMTYHPLLNSCNRITRKMYSLKWFKKVIQFTTSDDF